MFFQYLSCSHPCYDIYFHLGALKKAKSYVRTVEKKENTNWGLKCSTHSSLFFLSYQDKVYLTCKQKQVKSFVKHAILFKKNTHVTDDPKAIPLREGSPDNPESPLISADIVLPEDEFASYQSYLLYEIVRAKYIMINFLLFVLTILATLTNIWFSGVLSPAMVIRICLGGSMVVLQIWSFSRPISNETFRTKLLLEVITHRPSIAGKEWKTITYNMNQYLFKAGLWKTPYHFFLWTPVLWIFQGSHKGKISWCTVGYSEYTAVHQCSRKSGCNSKFWCWTNRKVVPL